MLKTDLLDRFLTDSVKHKKPMECSEALFDTIDTLFLQVNPDGTFKSVSYTHLTLPTIYSV